MKSSLVLLLTALALSSCAAPPRPLDVSDYAEQIANEQAQQILLSL